MGNNRWICPCGKENTSNFCTDCGRPRNAGTEIVESVRPQPQPQQPQQMATVGARSDSAALKKWAGSWIVLVLAVLSSVSLICTLIPFFMNLSYGFNMYMISDIVGILFVMLVCIGFWRSFAMGKSKNDKVSSGGPRMLRGMLVVYQVLTYILMILLILMAIMLAIAASSPMVEEIVGEVLAVFAQAGIDLSFLFEGGMTILIIIIVALIIAFVLVIVFFTCARRFARQVVRRLDGTTNEYKGATAIGVMFFIIGIFSLLSAIMSVMPLDMLYSILSAMGDFGVIIAGYIPVNAGWVAIISSFAGALTYLFAGMLAFSFNGVQRRIDSARNM